LGGRAAPEADVEIARILERAGRKLEGKSATMAEIVTNRSEDWHRFERGDPDAAAPGTTLCRGLIRWAEEWARLARSEDADLHGAMAQFARKILVMLP
jgi:hypothetical protein